MFKGIIGFFIILAVSALLFYKYSYNLSQTTNQTQQEKLRLEQFKKIKRNMSEQQVVALVGKADKDVGSGIYVWKYDITTTSYILIGIVPGQGVSYVRYYNGNQIQVLIGE